MPDSSTDGGGDDLQDAAVRSDLGDAVSTPAEARSVPVDGISTPAEEVSTQAHSIAAPIERRPPAWPVFLGLAVTVVVLDQLAKSWVVANIDPQQPVSVIGDLVRLIYSHNTGALFGLFRDSAALFAIASLGVIVGIAWYHRRSPRSLVLSIALGLLAGGAIGNLIDRLAHGFVVDFVDAGIGDLRFYTFNIADSAISTALLLLILLTLRPSLAGEDPAAKANARPADDRNRMADA